MKYVQSCSHAVPEFIIRAVKVAAKSIRIMSFWDLENMNFNLLLQLLRQYEKHHVMIPLLINQSNDSLDFPLQLSKCLADSDLVVIGLTGIGPIRKISVLDWFLPGTLILGQSLILALKPSFSKQNKHISEESNQLLLDVVTWTAIIWMTDRLPAVGYIFHKSVGKYPYWTGFCQGGWRIFAHGTLLWNI
jgi:hypothetical protein